MTKNSRSVLVTGADGALGAKVYERFLAAGHEVHATYHLEKPKSDASVHWHQVDLGDSRAVHSVLGALKIDQLVHCAGGFRFANAEQTSDADLDFLINSNLKSAFYLVRELLPKMKERNYGRIVFISSRATLASPAGMAAYAASKSGLNMLVSSLAEETRKFDINVNAVMPTVIDTPANRRDMPKADFNQWVSAEALAEIIFSLTEPWGKPIHGALLPVAGRL
ncbi:MAG: SDR family NAD(P)-dependent oxidoreductase [Bdellovibrionota bacterium]